MLISLKDYIQNDSEPISESLVGKGFAISQQRKHAANKTKLLSVVSRIQNLAKKGASEPDPEKQAKLVFQLFFELGNAMKIYAEMSENLVNVGVASHLDRNEKT